MMTHTLFTLLIAATIGLAGVRAGGVLTLSVVASAFFVQNGFLLVGGAMPPLEAVGAILAFNVGAGIALALRPAARPGTA